MLLFLKDFPSRKFFFFSKLTIYQGWQLAIFLAASERAFASTASASCGITGYSSGSQVAASYAFHTVVDLSGLFKLIPGLTGGSNPLNVTLNAKSCHP